MICVFWDWRKNQVKCLKYWNGQGIFEEDETGTPIVILYAFNWNLFINQLCLIKGFKYKQKFLKIQLSATYSLIAIVLIEFHKVLKNRP